MKFRDKYAVKVDLRDAIMGGIFIYFTVYLLSFAFSGALSIIYGFFYPSGMPEVFQKVANDNSVWLNSGTMPIVLAVVLAVALITFLVVILSEEHYFSKHEKTGRDLFGLGLVWGTVFIAVESVLNSSFSSINILVGYPVMPFGVRAFTTEVLFWPMVIYIVSLPWFFHYSKRVKERGSK